MNFLPKLLTLFLILSICSCEEKSSSKESSPNTTISDSTTQTDPPKSEEEAQEELLPSFYVKAPSGLNFRKAPKGEILGKFPFNAEVQIIERSGILEEIKDEDEVLAGEWVGVQHAEQIVYVFDAFLNDEVNEDPSFAMSVLKGLDIYLLGGYETIRNEASIPFVSLTDSYPWHEDEDSLAIAPEYLGENEVPEYHSLGKKYRKRFMKRAGIKESDRVYIYNFADDKLRTFAVSELPLFAHLTVYGASSPVAPYDYLVGFNLDEKLSEDEYDVYPSPLVYVGKRNPFTQGQMTDIIWTEMAHDLFPKTSFTPQREERLKSYEPKKTYQFKSDGLTYWVQDYGYSARHLHVQNAQGETLFNQIYFDGESTSLAPLNQTNPENSTSKGQWTGKLFKDKAPVMLGFFYESFGCESIYLLDKSNKIIPTLCDNRH